MNPAFRRVVAAGWVLCALGWFGGSAAFAELEAISTQTPWRAYLVIGAGLSREKGELKIRGRGRPAVFDPAKPDPTRFSPLPPADWMEAGFDASCWARYQDDLFDFLGDYGVVVQGGLRAAWPSLLCLRTCFGIADPGKASGLKVTATCLGGGVVYVNGQEIGRGYLPQGDIAPLTPADDYPVEAYTTEDGKTPLPVLQWKTPMEEKWRKRYGKRVRTFTVNVPPRVLVKGRNVLAVELHQAAVAGPLHRRGGWSHVGIRGIKVTRARGAGVIPYAEAVKGTRVWSAHAVEQVTETLPTKSLVKRSWFWTLVWTRGMPVKGVQMGNPFDPVLPVKMIVPRNGVGSGQTVLSDPSGLHGVSAAIADLEGPSGAVMPASAVQIRFAAQHPGVHYCDALMEEAPDGAKTVPVWLLLQAPKDQTPGWYVSTLNLEANGKRFTVPVQVLVTGFTVPDAKDFQSHIGMVHSPETVALHYKVEPWSDEHFKLMDRSLALMGQVGNDVVIVPVILGGFRPSWKSKPLATTKSAWRAPLVRWVKTPEGLKPDFSLLEKYLDAYRKHCAPPKALCLYIWEASSSKEWADAYEGRRIPSRQYTPTVPLQVAVWDPKSGDTSAAKVPAIGDEGSEAFWRPLLDGVRRIVRRRGWSERCIMLGLGGDLRPGQKTGELMRKWAPYARWNLLSHFSGDPGPKDGKLIATGGLEIGLKEWPWLLFGRPLPALRLEERLGRPLDFIELPTARWHWQEYSPPLIFRTVPLQWGCVGRIGLDFWARGRGAPTNTSFFSHLNSLTIPGPDGAIPTVRFQMLREGVQDFEARMAVVRALARLPEDQRKPYRALLDELGRRMAMGHSYLSQHELSYDWPSYVAKVHLAAAELAGANAKARWDAPPATAAGGAK